MEPLARRPVVAADTEFSLTPLFSIPDRALGIADGDHREWYLANPRDADQSANPWDVAYAAYAAISSDASLAGTSPDLVEPDLLQDWPFQKAVAPESHGIAAQVCQFDDQCNKLPRRPRHFAWHLDDDGAQLRDARKEAAKLGDTPVRIVHLDTGFDPQHSTLVTGQVDRELQRNFIDADRRDDASDPLNSGVMKNPGHGTGTLSILAGGPFRFSDGTYQFNDVLGAAPAARIVPVRVGNSVVQLYTSSVARGIAYAAELCRDPATRVDVISMSMGGLASAAWADAVNLAYESGVCFVAAAGNNFSGGFFGFPTRFIVYPARFRRVIAACGVMADRRPYYGLKLGTMQGNWGPDSKMATAIAAFTPNVPWAQIGCPGIVDMNGAGTSAATPQVAGAAALYLRKHGRVLFDPQNYPEPWMRVEAVCRALFRRADRTADRGRSEKLGNGILQAADALAENPPDAQMLRKTKPDRASFAFLRVLTGLGVTDSTTDHMLQLEATQLAQRWEREDSPNAFESAVADPDRPAEDVSENEVRRFLELVAEHPQASRRLKERAKVVLGGTGPRRVVPVPERRDAAPAAAIAVAPSVTPQVPTRPPYVPPTPPFRTLRGYAFDPSLTTALDTVGISEVDLNAPWEKLAPGPRGEYVEVIDVDPASQCSYDPVDLDDPAVLAQDGLPPGEGTPRFHQQMVYAVCSLTIANFEHALGRRTLWRPGPARKGQHPKNDSHFVPRLRIYPHALREANAYYSPAKVALLFGYFDASGDDPGGHMPGGRVFTCLSHDVVAHETTHALLDGMHRRFVLPSNPDVRAFHEAFADCVALFQHFTFPEILRHQIASTRGEIRAQENLLGELAGQFGRTTGRRQALRDAIGRRGEDGVWRPHVPDPSEYQAMTEPHDRGAILVAAVFDAFMSIYERRTADLLRLATGGTGVLRPGAIHPDLVARLAGEAAKSARHVLTMCIRALDYCPPTDITFGEYLRALVTADYDLVPDDDLNYRVAFIDAFRRRGIYPADVRTLGLESLLWRGPEDGDEWPPSAKLQDGLERLREHATAHAYAGSREEVFHLQRAMRRDLHAWLARHFREDARHGPRDAEFLGLDPARGFEVHTARFANRTSPDGGIESQLLLGLLQEKQEPVDPTDPKGPRMSFEGGCTIVADLRNRRIRYCVRKRLASATRLARQQHFAAREFDSLRATYLGAHPLTGGEWPAGDEPFAMIHRGF